MQTKKIKDFCTNDLITDNELCAALAKFAEKEHSAENMVFLYKMSSIYQLYKLIVDLDKEIQKMRESDSWDKTIYEDKSIKLEELRLQFVEVVRKCVGENGHLIDVYFPEFDIKEPNPLVITLPENSLVGVQINLSTTDINAPNKNNIRAVYSELKANLRMLNKIDAYEKNGSDKVMQRSVSDLKQEFLDKQEDIFVGIGIELGIAYGSVLDLFGFDAMQRFRVSAMGKEFSRQRIEEADRIKSKLVILRAAVIKKTMAIQDENNQHVKDDSDKKHHHESLKKPHEIKAQIEQLMGEDDLILIKQGHVDVQRKLLELGWITTEIYAVSPISYECHTEPTTPEKPVEKEANKIKRRHLSGISLSKLFESSSQSQKPIRTRSASFGERDSRNTKLARTTPKDFIDELESAQPSRSLTPDLDTLIMSSPPQTPLLSPSTSVSSRSHMSISSSPSVTRTPSPSFLMLSSCPPSPHSVGGSSMDSTSTDKPSPTKDPSPTQSVSSPSLILSNNISPVRRKPSVRVPNGFWSTSPPSGTSSLPPKPNKKVAGGKPQQT